MTEYPEPNSIIIDADGGLNIAWTYRDRRALIHLERDMSESGWHTYEKDGDGGDYGGLDTLDMNKIYEFISESSDLKSRR